MGVVGIAIKGFGKALKKVGKRAKEDAPFVGAVGAVLTGRHAYNKIKKRPTDLDVVRKVIKKVRNKEK